IAFKHSSLEKGIRSFNIIATQAAGSTPVEINNENACIEIMTGAGLPESTDTVIGYEDVEIKNGMATIILNSIKKGNGIHSKGKDKIKNEVVARAGQLITPALIGVAASIGKTKLAVKKLPRIIIISTGDELVEVDQTPSPFQIRRSNNYTIKAALCQLKVNADMLHIPDNAATIKEQVNQCLQNYDAIILSGGVSMGKFDYVPQALEELSVNKLFHKVKQKPGKPFWFGSHENGTIIFALPGNPVSTFMCATRYVLPWLKACLELPFTPEVYAILDKDISFATALQYFLQVKLNVNNDGTLHAVPCEGNGSGDFGNLVLADAFMELPLEQNNFTKGEAFRIWPYKEIFL
ncbi:MAG: molybdopterin molybdotransferase MoeA, partial [Bacteroidota bacterium]|nr:molybdopterin molybdotransferase MoeA [Bacteroidota bacterium]